MKPLTKEQRERLIALENWEPKELEKLFMKRDWEARMQHGKIARLGAIEWLKSLSSYERKAILYFIDDGLVRGEYQPDEGGGCIVCGASVWREWYEHIETNKAVKIIWRDCGCDY